MEEPVFVFLTFALIAFLVAQAIHSIQHLLLAKKIGKSALSFSNFPKDATQRFLVVGDSTAFGTGATDPKNSVAGRLAQDFPGAQIENLAKNGINTRELRWILETIKTQRFDLIVMHIGGIDILSFTSLSQIRKHLTEILMLAQKLSKHVILVSAMNVGSSPVFWFPISTLYSHRTRAVRKIFLEESKKAAVPYVDLYRQKRHDPFCHSPETFFAPDKIHPNDLGYGLWYENIKKDLLKLPLVLPPQ
jgi:lysophospholipase L1-like esterase